MATNATKLSLVGSIINTFKTNPLVAIILVAIGLLIGIIIDKIISASMV
jgi:hypothetical protein